MLSLLGCLFKTEKMNLGGRRRGRRDKRLMVTRTMVMKHACSTDLLFLCVAAAAPPGRPPHIHLDASVRVVHQTPVEWMADGFYFRCSWFSRGFHAASPAAPLLLL
jgi:hypothetical protein